MTNLATIARPNIDAVLSRASLTSALATVIHVIEGSRYLPPILSNVCLTGHGDLLTVTSTDLDLQISVHIPAAADPALAVTIPAKLLSDLAKKAPKSEFVSIIDSGEGRAVADFERSKYNLITLPADQYPVLKESNWSHSFSISGAVLWDMIDSVDGAISKEEKRYYLNGIYCHTVELESGPVLRMVTTDGHKLFRRDVPMPEGAANMPGVIIPRKTIEIFQKITKGKLCPDSVKIDLSDTKFKFSFDNVEVLSKLVDGTFPDYNRVIPAYHDKTAKISAKSLLEGVAGVSLMSADRGRMVRYAFSGNSVTLAVRNPDQGDAEMTIPCAFYGEPMDIGFDAAYMVELIATATPRGGEITIKLGDCASPTLFTGSRAGWMGVIMPMRL